MSKKHLKKLGKTSYVPNGWEITTVGQACKIRNDLRKPISVDERKGMQGEYPYYGPTGVLDFIDHHRVDGKYALIGEDGDHYLKPTKKPQTILAEGQFNVNNHAHIIEGSSKCLTEWFYIYFHNRDITHMLSRQGANRYKLKKETLSSLPILLPSIDEQVEIYTIFHFCVSVIEKIEALIDAKERQFGWLVKKLINDREKNTERLGNISKMSSGGTPKSIVNTYYGGPIPWVSITDMTEKGMWINFTQRNLTQEGLENSSAKIYPRNTVLYAMYASIGECSIANIELSSSQAILGIIPNTKQLYHEYLYYYLSSQKEKIKLQGQWGTQSNLNAKIVKSFKIPLPCLSEQKRIAHILNTAQQEITLLKKLAEQYRIQKRGLMQKLLSGEWKVKNKEAT